MIGQQEAKEALKNIHSMYQGSPKGDELARNAQHYITTLDHIIYKTSRGHALDEEGVHIIIEHLFDVLELAIFDDVCAILAAIDMCPTFGHGQGSIEFYYGYGLMMRGQGFESPSEAMYGFLRDFIKKFIKK